MRTLRLIQLGLGALCLAHVATPASSQGPASCTGDTAVVEHGDTLSAIAARCGVSERTILAANASVESSEDLRVGATVRVRETERGFGQRLTELASDTSDAVGRIANRVGSSAQDLLDRNPDLKSRLERLGRHIGIGGAAPAEPAATIRPQSGAVGTIVTVSATGLPIGTAVTAAAGPPGAAAQTLREARSSTSGTITASVAVPAADSGSTLVFSVRAGGSSSARAGRFQVTH